MNRKFSVLLCAVSAAYTLWYLHFDKPWTNDGALSTIGLTHRGLFALWGVLTYAALSYALLLAYRRYSRIRCVLPLLLLAGVGMALTLLFRFDYDIKPDYYFHCAGSLLFSAVTGTAVFLLFVLAKQPWFAVITAVLLLGDTVCLIIFKETGLIEAVPILAGYVLLCIANLRREKSEVTRSA